ncbi:MAG: toxin-antitoxin system HicB family antitoxin [Solirubrobacteraceae bacterium MAG38_C4-C5]|nr:toxin-antitoxin system HicB family antitoxin [Candidatus Siliceabacter maunaloa]
MKQLIARIDDDLHARLKQRAAFEGRSLNALVTETLEGAAPPREETPQAWLRRRAHERGVRLLGPADQPSDPAELDRVIEANRGLGPFIDEFIEEDRRDRF